MITNTKSIYLFLVFFFSFRPTNAQVVNPSTIIQVIEDDRCATLYWNSKTQIYDYRYDSDKTQKGIYSYMIEWGKVSSGFTDKKITPYRVHMIQPLEPGVDYQARVYSIDNYGNKSAPSSKVTFRHDDTRVNAMRTRLNGFFDDFNQPMGAFDEKKWNQSYSGCINIGSVSQHINNQFHGHNVIASDKCDRAVASSRTRTNFDFTNRTGTIEFDLDGAKLSRNFWYLDITPADKKRDLTGFTALEINGTPPQCDPAHLLRILEREGKIQIQLSDADGYLRTLTSIYNNSACGNNLKYCTGENLHPIPNVRRHWKINLSKTNITIHINNILVVDASLQTTYTPSGLTFEVGQVNWLFFSYNTGKENVPYTMLHWDNFGFDAPSNWTNTEVVHNYTDGVLGTNSTYADNEKSEGMHSQLNTPATFTIKIPDNIKDNNNAWPLLTQLMFTMQGNSYSWTANDKIIVNGNQYLFTKPSSSIPNFPSSELITSTKPYSALVSIDPTHLISGDNIIKLHLNDVRILNPHIELTFPLASEPTYTPPKSIHANYNQTLMNFKNTAVVGPGLVFNKVDGYELYQSEFSKVNDPISGQVLRYVKSTPVVDNFDVDIIGDCFSQLAASGHAHGIKEYSIYLDNNKVSTVLFNNDTTPTFFHHKNVNVDVTSLIDGTHELFIQGQDADGKISTFNSFFAHAESGEYIPIVIEVRNTNPVPVELLNQRVFWSDHNFLESTIEWSTASETDNSHFIIERSYDGYTFKAISLVPSKSSNSNTIQTYSQLDNSIQPNSNIIYYRITQVDFDGKQETFPVIVLHHFNDKLIKMFPNPANDILNIQIDEWFYHEKIKLIIRDVLGREVIVKTINPKQKNQIKISKLNDGSYTVFFIDESNNLKNIKKLIKH